MRLELARLEAAELGSGANSSVHSTVSPSELISTGIELEEQQYVLQIIFVVRSTYRSKGDV